MRKKEKVGDLQQYMARYILTAVSILVVSSFLTYTYSHGDILSLSFEPILFHFDSILVILISGIIGFVPAIISFLLLFICTVLVDISRSYMVFVYLIATIISFLATRRGWYKNGLLRMPLLAVLLAFLLGDIRLLLSNLTSGMGVSDITASKFLYYFLGELPECILGVLICYLFLERCPDVVRSLTLPGRLYMGDFSDKDMFAQLRSSKLARIVTVLIVMEGLVLGISAAGFANVLLPSLGEEVFTTVEGNFFQDLMRFNRENGDSGTLPTRSEGTSLASGEITSGKEKDTASDEASTRKVQATADKETAKKEQAVSGRETAKEEQAVSSRKTAREAQAVSDKETAKTAQAASDKVSAQTTKVTFDKESAAKAKTASDTVSGSSAENAVAPSSTRSDGGASAKDGEQSGKANGNSSESAQDSAEEGAAQDSDDEVTEAQEEEDQASSQISRHRYRRFVLNQSGLAFDLKLIMLLLNIMIPFTVLSNLVAQRLIVTPIILMSSTIGEFCDVPQDKKQETLGEIRSLPIYSRNEIGDLYRALRHMAVNIVAFVDKEREKERLEAKLKIAQKTSENKNNFLSNVSHELRTPINAVLGLDEMILRETKEEDTRQYASDIQNTGKSLLGLVNDILDSSKLEEGKMELIPTAYELSSVVNDLINMISVKASDKNLQLDVIVDETTPHVLYGDEIRLKQVILNILTNAVKYTEEGSVTMEIGYQTIDESYIYLEVSVRDTGIGIKEEDMDRLFSRFERIEEDRNKTIEGTGLGMNIVKRLLEMMETRLEVESVYGEGSNFHFRVCQKVINWQEIGDFTEAYKRSILADEAYVVEFVAPEACILVVDDTPLNLTVVKGLLKETQIQIDTATSGKEALEAVRKKHYDLIFLDQRMPEMDGIQTFHEMERLMEVNENLSAGVPVIALTANAVSGSREGFLNEGFTDYLSKPIDSRALEKTVFSYLPEVLVHDVGDVLPESTASAGDYDGSYDEAGMNETDAGHDSPLRGLAGLDYDSAVRNCGSEELLLEVLKDYLEVIPAKIMDIRRYLEEDDYENYTILVHAMKSSSRLIGAIQLSENAAYLESCGDRAQMGDEDAIQEIIEKTPELLKLYRSYYDKVTPLISGEEDEDLRPEIGLDELAEALRTIREFVEAFDFDSADGVMEMLGDYRIPESESERFGKVKQMLIAVDREALLGLL